MIVISFFVQLSGRHFKYLMSPCVSMWLIKRKPATLMTYPSHALSKTRGLLTTKCYSTWHKLIWWQWTMRNVRRQKSHRNKLFQTKYSFWQVTNWPFQRCAEDMAEVLLSPLWAACHAPPMFQQGFVESFRHLICLFNFKNSFQKPITKHNWKLLSGKCSRDLNDNS